MKLLNEEYQIYQGNISELTFGFVRHLSNFSNKDKLNQISVWYEEENDRFVINEDYVDKIYSFCIKGFQRPLDRLELRLPDFTCNQEIV